MIYLSGPMSGIADYNYPAFRAAARSLREQGHRILSPHEETPAVVDVQPWSYYIRRDIAALLRCEGLALLPGWEDSRGARLERLIAEALELQIYDVVDGQLREIP